jgi:hypothetical protein
MRFCLEQVGLFVESLRHRILPCWIGPHHLALHPQGLPVNDTWLVAGQAAAGGARDALDDLALKGGPTARAIGTLNSLVEVLKDRRDGGNLLLICGRVHLPDH